MITKRSAVTLIEIVVGAFITTIIGGMIFVFISNARHTAAVTTARNRAKQDTQLIVRHLTKDISNSRADVVKDTDGKLKAKKTLKVTSNKITAEIPRINTDTNKTYFGQNKVAKDNDYKEVIYNLVGTTLTRTTEDTNGVSKTSTLSKGVKELVAEDNYDGSVKLRVMVEKNISGSNDKLEHVERISISIREAEKGLLDKRWRQRIGAGDY